MVSARRVTLPPDLRVQCDLYKRMVGGRTWGNPYGEPVYRDREDTPWRFLHLECIPPQTTMKEAP